jgi:lactoylglutathione lyase
MPRICVIQINVTDMDRAVDFYSNKLGFRVASREHYPQIVKLEHEAVPLLLYKVDREARTDYPDGAQTLINLETDDLRRDLERLRGEGVEVIQDAPVDCPVGIYAGIRDPFGNVLELVEYQRRTG